MQQQYNQNQGYANEQLFNTNSSGYYPEAEQELLKIIISVKELLENFEHETLRGEFAVQDQNDGKVWKKLHTVQIINEIGITEIKARLTGIVNEKTPIGYISEEDYYKKMFYFDMSVAEMFAKRADAWELNLEMAKAIKDSMIEIAEAVLSMCKEGFTAINFKTQYQKQDIQRTEPAGAGGQKSTFLGIPIKR